jgi:hypothetical protein
MQYLHTYEVESEDQMIILAYEQAINGVIYPNVFNIALQAYAEAFLNVHPEKDYPLVHDFGYDVPCSIIGLSKDQLLQYSGHSHINILALHINSYFTNKVKYAEALPHIAKQFETIFNV